MPTRKTPTAKSSAKKKTAAQRSVAKKALPGKDAAKSAPTTSRPAASEGALHHVARSIGSTLGSIAKKTSKAVEVAKQALPGVSNPENKPE